MYTKIDAYARVRRDVLARNRRERRPIFRMQVIRIFMEKERGAWSGKKRPYNVPVYET